MGTIMTYSRLQQSLASNENLLAFWGRPDAAVLALITIFLIVRFVLAATLGFAVDESYTIANARVLSLSYFDHPPMVYWIAHAFMPVVGEGHALRVPFIILFSGSSWLLYLLTRGLFGAPAGVWAVLSLNLSAFFTVSAGCWIVPDGPLIFFLLAAALTLANAFFPDGTPPSPWRTWIITGVCIGLAALSKYHAALFGLSVFFYIVSVPGRRRILLHPAPWVGAFIALGFSLPVLLWNAEHNWVSFVFQGGHAAVRGGLHVGNVIVIALGQAVWIFPWIFVPIAVAAWQALRAGRTQEKKWYCVCLGVPPILFFTIIPLWGDRGLPHWAMPGWLMLYPVLGELLDRESRERPWPVRWAIASALLFVALLVPAAAHTVTGYGKVLFPDLFVCGDPTLEAVEWSPLAAELKARGYLERKDMFVVAPNWLEAGRIDQAIGGVLPVVVFPDMNEPKNFEFRYDQNMFVGRDALIIGRTLSPGMRAQLRQYFGSVEELPPFSFGRSGMKEIELNIMLGKRLLRPVPPYYAR